MMIIQNHLDELLNLPEITKDNKADTIQKFIWHIQTHVSALKTLALPVDEWDSILIYLAKKKLDFIEEKGLAASHKESNSGQYAKIIGIY